MARASLRARRQSVDYWPGFVDALTTLLLVIIFILSVFMLAQFFMSQLLSGKDEALAKLTSQINELTDLLALEKSANEDLRLSITQLSASLQTATRERDEAQSELTDRRSQIANLTALLADRDAALTAMGARAAQLRESLEAEQDVSREALAQVELLNQQLAALRTELASVSAQLDAAEAKDKESQAVIADLGKRLNRALAAKVEELAKFRSEFFGRLRKILGNRQDIRIEGDRFVFQSEVLFKSGSATLGTGGRRELGKVAKALLQISRQIPADVPWIVRVDGHTDAVPINTPTFPSNWELSTARATSVVKFLVSQGVPQNRLAAAGFGEFQPLDHRHTRAAFRKNRRIELKLTKR